MKKILVRVLIALLLLVVLAAIGVHLFLDGIVKRAVEKFGPQLTKVEVRLNTVNLSLLSGSGKLSGLFIGNPQGFSSPSALQVGSTSVSLEPKSLLGDKIIVQSINLQNPEVTFETDLKSNNLGKIRKNLEETTGGSSDSTAPKEPASSEANKKKLQVDEFVLTGGKVRVTVTAFGGKTAVVPLPDIHLKDLGKGPDGITPAELTREVLAAIETEAAKAASSAIADLSKGAVYMGQDLGKVATNSTIEKASKSISDLFKKKK